jgi:hypothetical protein
VSYAVADQARKRIMKVLFGEDLCAGEETCVQIRVKSGERGEEGDWMKIAEQGELSADPEGIEACPVETIVRTWRQLRRTLQVTSSTHRLLALR